MEAAPEALDPHRDDPVEVAGFTGLELAGLTEAPPAVVAEPRPVAPPRARRRARRLSAVARQELLWICVIYLAARGLILLGAFLLDAFGHHPLQSELAHWDGLWYRAVADHGYPTHVSYQQTNLGFFPLFPVTMYLLSPLLELTAFHDQISAATYAGVIISGAGGLVATVFVHKLAEGWFNREAARRATLLFVLFPGSVVFSMVYSEGLLLPMTVVCIWALERRRWMLAGVMAGLGTAVQPVGLLLGVVCASVALRELWRHGWRAPSFRHSLLATILSGTGAVAFMAFLWAWTGNPFANYIAQHHGWGEKTDVLALVHDVTRVAPSFDPAHFNHPTINLNLVIGVVGAVIMAAELVLLWRSRREVSLPAIVWTLGITFLAVTSSNVPPNPRMLITAFPMLMLVARWAHGRGWTIIMWVNGAAFIGLSLLTFTGHTLRP